MRLFRTLVCLILVAFFSGCACRTKTRAPDADNVPLAEAGQELEDINFAFDRYDLSSTAKSALAKNGDWLKENSSTSIVVEGHCDERGTREYNLVLGQKRAQAAYDYLRGLGVADSRMSTVSYGEDLPLDPRSNEVAWAKNRRAHFRVER
ncbi:MAG: peptidoglycan-associated lipoprotein Pal [Bdellovibrionales bacterium]|nr:peptidoglycan-associated lipoprotein Pal [Bdellovibrionales bacterium]